MMVSGLLIAWPIDMLADLPYTECIDTITVGGGHMRIRAKELNQARKRKDEAYKKRLREAKQEVKAAPAAKKK
jgi:hypothetical protein